MLRFIRKFSIPLLATLFNLFFEYSLRGLNGFLLNPGLIIFLFLVYFCWFALAEDAIRRYKLSEKQIFLLPLVGIATIYSALFIPSQAYYASPLILGINWGQFLWVNLIWWTLLQTIMTFYFANRLSPRKSMEPLLSKKGRVITLGIWLLVGLLFRMQIGIGPLSPITYVSVVVITGLAVLTIKKLQRKPKPQKGEKSLLMDILTGATILVFISSALKYNHFGVSDYHPINVDSLLPMIKWTTFSGVIMLLHRWISKKPWMV